MERLSVYKDKTVLVTGHTGFKGAWLSLMLLKLGAKVVGYALDPEYEDCLFLKAGLKNRMVDIRADIRDIDKLKGCFNAHAPDFVFHLAAQPLVKLSYEKTRYTFEDNIMGTVNILECIKEFKPKSSVIITSDKCYKPKGKKAYTEDDELGGNDPYSASKACAEIVTASYRKSFSLNVASVRAGNVIGGGDFSKDRLIPDCVKSLEKRKPIVIRNPGYVRPWQHVLDPLYGYLLLGQALHDDKSYSEAFNFGPDSGEVYPVKDVVESFLKYWGDGNWKHLRTDNLSETEYLALDSAKAKKMLNWKPLLSFEESIKMTVEWYKNYKKADMHKFTLDQIGRIIK